MFLGSGKSSIEKSIRFGIVAISFLAVVSMATLGGKLAADASNATLQDLTDISREAVLARLTKNVGLIVRDFEEMAKSTVLGTSLTDTAGREAYLTPFLEQRARTTDMSFSLYDYRGRILIAVGKKLPSSLSASQVIGEGDKLYIRMDGGRVILGSPIIFHGDNMPIGYLIGNIPASNLTDDAILIVDRFFNADVDLRAADPSFLESNLIYRAGSTALFAIISISPSTNLIPEVVRKFSIFGIIASTFILLLSFFVSHLIARLISAPIVHLTREVVSPVGPTILPSEQGLVLEEVEVLRHALHSAFEQRRKAIEQLESVVRIDPLTGCLSRVNFELEARLALELALRFEADLALVYLDLDNFKQVNDQYGHDAGDEVLRAVSARIRSRLRQTDLFGRRGGDEFVILLQPASNKDDISYLIWEIAQIIKIPIDVGVTSITIGCSFGVALFWEDADSIDGLLTCADNAMYAAKKFGRNYLVFADGVSMSLKDPPWEQSVVQ